MLIYEELEKFLLLFGQYWYLCSLVPWITTLLSGLAGSLIVILTGLVVRPY